VKALTDTLAFLLRFGAFLIAAAAALAVLAAHGGRFSDRLDILTHFAPMWMALGLIGLLLWALAGGRQIIALTPLAAAIAVLGAGALIMPELSRTRGPKAPAEGETLKLIQFNLWAQNRDPQAAAEWIIGQDPDIITFEEGFAVTGGVARLLAERYPYRITCADPSPCSTMILSKRKPVFRTGLSTAVSNSHLSAALAKFETAGGPFSVIAIHYTWPIPAGPQQQQGLRLLKVLDTLDRDSAIVAGDFNSTPWSFSLRRQDKAFGMLRRTHGEATWPVQAIGDTGFAPPFPLLPIDQVYAGKQWKTVSVERGPNLGSDHLPVVVVLRR
jgi:endonuclease/exonuclease/phosphatase (EEP) superfamily protein YafD